MTQANNGAICSFAILIFAIASDYTRPHRSDPTVAGTGGLVTL